MATLALMALHADASEVKSAAKEIVGVWKLDFVSPEGERLTPMVVVGRQRQELVAWVAENEELQAFEEVCLKGESLLATFKPKQHGGDVTVTLEASLERKDICRGEAKYATQGGDSGTFDFTGERIPASKMDGLVRWDLSFVTPDFERHEALVTLVPVGDKEYGWYSGKDYELPILKASSKDGKLVMSVTAQTEDGGKVEVTFQGTVEGSRVKGTAEYKMEGESGSFAFSGKLKS